MSEKKARATRTTRSTEEKIKEIDLAIAKHEANIASLKAKKENILNPKPRGGGRIGIATVIKRAKELGLSPEELLKKLEN